MSRYAKELENLRRYVESLKNAPMTVEEYLDQELPDRKTDAVQAAWQPAVLSALGHAQNGGILRIDLPITENSVIHGITSDGFAALKALEKYVGPL
ncbi:hypothetical protein [Pseudomonas chlororaphis]|uniref:hypothetical protein n=1 Tax=Pseudomonas chlororaphis TaxID=587753 RepID=UPI001928B958|nr:hypothetical protein [Pseudomonas chlororaphis]QQX60926.1 hypothetical protein JHW28_10395 [Pseudomonas chlororaphis subsp. aurantiaca]